MPWSALTVDTGERRLVLNVKQGQLASAPGFDKEHWPDMADQAWGAEAYRYYGSKPYWE